MKILVAVDGSSYTQRLLDYLVAHAGWLVAGHELTLLTVVAPVPPGAASVLARDVLQSYYDDEAEKVLAPVRAALERHGIAAQFVGKTGHAAEAIAAAASAGGYELIMLGSHGHGALGRLVMGSVTAKVLAGCTTPALLVR